MSETYELHGGHALPSRRFALLDAVLADPGGVASLLATYGSPVNLLHAEPLALNAEELASAARDRGVELQLCFARKANKTLAVVRQALRHGHGVDVASDRELEQVLAAGAAPDKIVVTAAVKNAALLRRATGAGVPVVLDNADEASDWVAAAAGTDARAGLRLAADLPHAPPSRFGLPAAALLELAARPQLAGRVEGVHFHLDGYRPEDRSTALGEALVLVDALRASGQPVAWIDAGGGVPMRYSDAADGWEQFWRALEQSLVDPAAPAVTCRRHGLGLHAAGGVLTGQRAVYPVAQALTRGDWLGAVLDAPAGSAAGGDTLARALTQRGLQLRLEPGRALLDGCGVTVARVAFTKPAADGTEFVGLQMNRTQVRSAAEDFLVDPVLLRPQPVPADRSAPFTGHLVGAYCIERELLTWRTLRFPAGAAPGDLVAFPNTAGYLMHILESASHQLPLAANVLVDVAGGKLVDRGRDDIDAISPLRPWS